MDTIKAWISRLKGPGARPDTPGEESPRDYRQERDSDRTGSMSAEDQAWEAATTQRHKDAQDRTQSPPGAR